MPNRSVTPRRLASLCAELRRNGIDPHRPPEDAVMDYVKRRYYEDPKDGRKNKIKKQWYEEWMLQKI